jgi:hypothetical protein
MCLLLVLCVFSAGEKSAQAQTLDRGLEGIGPAAHDYGNAMFSSDLQEDSAEIVMVYTTAYPGHFAKIENRVATEKPRAHCCVSIYDQREQS